FGADLIAGFPTETDAMDKSSLDLIDDAGLTFLHVFPYSVRPDTPAAKMPQVNGRAIKARAAALRDKGQTALGAWLGGQVGETADVLMESEHIGRSAHYASVQMNGVAGALMKARITGVNADSLVGEPVSC